MLTAIGKTPFATCCDGFVIIVINGLGLAKRGSTYLSVSHSGLFTNAVSGCLVLALPVWERQVYEHG
jgi:hypothetical protein